MLNFKKGAPQTPFVLASLLLWTSFAWGLPAEAAAEGESETSPPAEAAAEDRWAGVKISDAYDYAKCPRCGHKNEVRRPACYRCGYPLPQPSGEYTYPPWVFVPGKGYYREGTVVEPRKSRRNGLWTAGLALTGAGITMLIGGATSEYSGEGIPAMVITIPLGVGMTVFGIWLFKFGFKKTETIYAFKTGTLNDPYAVAYERRSPDSDGVALEVELTVLGF